MLADKDTITSIAIGSFDGIHIAHKKLFEKLDKKNGGVLVIRKEKEFLTPGFDRCNYIDFPCFFYSINKIKHLSGEEFVKLLVDDFKNLKNIVVGYDFKFAKNGVCNINNLITMMKKYEKRVIVVNEVRLTDISIHSRVIVDLLKSGSIKMANKLLGRMYSINGKHIEGSGIGKKELFPTINIKIENFTIPKYGVYAGWTQQANKKLLPSAIFIGDRLSTDNKFSIETYLIGKRNLVSQIDEDIRIFFSCFLRDNIKFKDISLLKKQIENDILSIKVKLLCIKDNI